MNLAKVQFLSVATKGVTTALGIIQTLIVIRVLSATEYGIVGLVMAIGGLIGVSQHLGIVDGAIREIAIRTDKDEIGKIFWISHIARQAVTLPLSLALVGLAGLIAIGIYGRPEIIPYIQLFAGALILQGLQDVLGATLTGMKKFVSLYIIQIITAGINIFAFGFLTWKYHIAGFFWAIIATTLLMVMLLGIVAGRELAGHLYLPNFQDIKRYGKALLHIGFFMYISRIFYVIWQRLPLLILGGILAGEELGYLNVSLTFGSKLIILAAALSEVNLSWMSTLFAKERDAFAKTVTRNMQRVLVLMTSITAALLFFIPEILHSIIRKPEYFAAQPTIIILTLSFFLYSLMDLGTSSVFVAANRPKLRAVVFGILTCISGAGTIWAFFAGGSATIAAAAMLAGALTAYSIMAALAKRLFGINLVPGHLLLLIILLFGSSAWLFVNPSLLSRILVFLALVFYTVWEAHKNNLVPLLRTSQDRPALNSQDIRIICFAGALFEQHGWTNRQHIMTRFAKEYPVLYIEPRVWIFRYMIEHIASPKKIIHLLRRIFSYEHVQDNLYIKSQWNLIPGSREFSWISALNHTLNTWSVMHTAKTAGFLDGTSVVWIYDTEAAEYLSEFPSATIVYDCVDDHAVQAGVNRNPARVHEEERKILKRSDLVTVTSQRLLKMKRKHAKNIHLVLNAGDVALYQKPLLPEAIQAAKNTLGHIPHPILGSVGALDSYKYDFELLVDSATRHPDWHFVFVGAPVVDHKTPALNKLKKLPNIHIIGSIPREYVPAYVAYFDICLIPYKNNEYNEASFPLKFWEFMATGKPIVASGVPELQEYEPMIAYANTPQEFSQKIQHILASGALIDGVRTELASHHGWDNRAAELKQLLLTTIQETIHI